MEVDLKVELPAFLYFLQERTFTVERESRMWFSHERIQAQALKRVKENSKKSLYKELLELLQNHFDEHPEDTIFANPVDIRKYLFEKNQPEASYIRKVLKEDFKYTPIHQKWYHPFNIIEETKWVNGKQEIVPVKQKSGTPYVFIRGEIELLYRRYVNV